MSNVDWASTEILGVRVDVIDLNGLMQSIDSAIRARKQSILCYVNIHAVNIAWEQRWFREYINGSDVAFCDGFGVKWAAGFLNNQQLFRLSPPDWFDALAAQCEALGASMYFLGSTESILEKTRAAVCMRHPALHVVGVHHGYFEKKEGSRENQAVLQQIDSLRPNVLVVGFGMPLQERWILDNRRSLHVDVVLSVGALFDYLSKQTRRAPSWMTQHGLEWLGRLLIEPGRLWKRYLIGNPLFVVRVLLSRIGLLRTD